MKKFKKLIVSAMAVVMCVTAIGVSSNEMVGAKSCKHSWKYQKTYNASCVVNGKKVYKCSKCKQTKSTVIKCHGKAIWKTTKNPTCTKDGTQKVYCSKCGKLTEVSSAGIPAGVKMYTKTIKALGHSYKKVSLSSSAKKKGYKKAYRCSRCGAMKYSK